MFLLEIWNNNVRTGDPDFRVSTQYLPWTNPWDEGLIDIHGVNHSIDSPHGGMIRASFGSFTTLPTILAEDYIGVKIYYSNTDEAGKFLLFDGVGFIKSRTRTVFAYDLFTDLPNTIIPAGGVNYTDGTYTSYPGSLPGTD